MSDAETIEHFYGVYLLYSQNPKYKGRIYIGYTVDPNRRIKQHNRGKDYGGAWKTNKKGPWTMVMIVHGFPNDISALRFEWAWQHPHVSRRLKHVAKKKYRETSFEFHFRVLSNMLSATPWSRLPLTVRWLDTSFKREFEVGNVPPSHMLITCGNVICKKPYNNQNKGKVSCYTCELCKSKIAEKKITCPNVLCDLVCHMLCLSDIILEAGEYVPIRGKCPKCKQQFLWGDIVKRYKGFDNNSDITIFLDDEFCQSDSE